MKNSKIIRALIRGLAVAIAAALLCVPQARAQAPSSGTKDRAATVVAEWTRARLGIQEYIDAMPDDGIGLKPTPEIRSFAEQMLHIATTNYMFAAAVSGRENPYDPSKGNDPMKNEELKKNKAALREFVLGSYDFLLESVQGFSSAQLDEPVKFFRMEMPRYLLLAKALEHHAHHRGQTTIYLRLKGITPPSERLF